MIEGYSVKEAASVLGVPKGRVWELLARGVLTGAPGDGGGMRVYLQGKPMERPLDRVRGAGPDEATPQSPDVHANGGGHGSPGFEASPYRELLTEFRNLTERYGQALLALGEARGEVASLRTRVEVLEARIDLRLPSSPPLVQWAPPQDIRAEETAPGASTAAALPSVIAEPLTSAFEAEAEPAQAAAPVEPAPIVEPAPDVEPAVSATIAIRPKSKPRSRRRKRGPRVATEGFAEALSRADDPTVALPGAEETGAALAELREEIARNAVVADLAGPEGTDAVGLGADVAPAVAVELDALLADESLGGSALEEDSTEGGTFAERSTEEAEPMAEAEPIADELSVMGIEQAREEDGAAFEAWVATPESDETDSRELDAGPAHTADEPQPRAYNSEWDEPDWIAEEDVDWGPEASASQTVLPAIALGESPEVGWAELPTSTESDIEEGEPEQAEGRDMAPAQGDTAGPIPVEAPQAQTMEVEPPAESPAEPPQTQAIVVEPPVEPLVEPQAVEPQTAEPQAAEPQTHAIEVEPSGAEAFGREPPGPETSSGQQPAAGEPHAPPSAATDSDQGDTRPSANQLDAPTPPAGERAPGGEEELMWLGDEFRPTSTPWSATGRVTTLPRQQVAQPLQVTRAEDEALAHLAVERGWDDAELHAIRALLAQPARSIRDERPSVSAQADSPPHEEEALDWEQGPAAWSPSGQGPGSFELPGAFELDEAMAAFEVGGGPRPSRLARSAHDQPNSRQAPESESDAQQPIGRSRPSEAAAREQQDAGREAGARLPIAEAQSPTSSSAASVSEADAEGSSPGDWLRGRRGPAATAYRRLRRLFP